MTGTESEVPDGAGAFDDTPASRPERLAALRDAARAAGFEMSCDERTGSLLATLAAAQPGGRILELGTGVGEGTAWLLDGMDVKAHLITVELDHAVQDVARRELGADPRVSFVAEDGGVWLETYDGPPFDLVFADTWPGKFTHLDRALDLVAPGGTYLIDDLAPRPDWPESHRAAVDDLLRTVEGLDGFRTTRLDWSSGLLIAVRSTA
ncbi:SAM-dependent methyltransferase [Streptomyces sp. SID8379]|uniref:O-methyltransferase n=1 Tax=unclassified Streptomyces TaxID=2593676 RepID=UPI000362ED4C|nr:MULTISPECIES: class I SAM-dependent methyltransferase [unclassified Streptomyces]MYW62738.1 SAM-dependent methyltransferase [Streptomyces sp. SID8379]